MLNFTKSSCPDVAGLVTQHVRYDIPVAKQNVFRFYCARLALPVRQSAPHCRQWAFGAYSEFSARSRFVAGLFVVRSRQGYPALQES